MAFFLTSWLLSFAQLREQLEKEGLLKFTVLKNLVHVAWSQGLRQANTLVPVHTGRSSLSHGTQRLEERNTETEWLMGPKTDFLIRPYLQPSRASQSAAARDHAFNIGVNFRDTMSKS